MTLRLKPIFPGVLLIIVSGCAAPVTEQDRSGFITDYSSLERVADNAYRYTGPKVKDYSSFIIDGPAMLFQNGSADGSREFSDAEVEELGIYFRERLTKALTEDHGYAVVTEPGPGVAIIRIGITALDATIGALNVTIYTKVTGAGLGGAAMEGEMVDSISNEQLAAAIQWGTGSRVLRAGLTRLGDAKLQINRWTANLRDRIDEAHRQATDTLESEW